MTGNCYQVFGLTKNEADALQDLEVLVGKPIPLVDSVDYYFSLIVSVT
ncbi:MAG: hypothetical protein ACXAEU_16290 [Candidatus Hodarchaeales archaeon]|jgi:hypothetical protein